jgi:hypothetical protein
METGVRRQLFKMSGAARRTVKGDCVRLSSKLMSQPKLQWSLLVLGAVYVLSGAAAHAQDIDQGKSATRLFADSCTTCHRSARGLAKGRFRPTLFVFLQEHYTSSYSTAWELASYLASVDNPPGGRSRAARIPSHPATTRSRIRPPMPVPSGRSN